MCVFLRALTWDIPISESVAGFSATFGYPDQRFGVVMLARLKSKISFSGNTQVSSNLRRTLGEGAAAQTFGSMQWERQRSERPLP